MQETDVGTDATQDEAGRDLDEIEPEDQDVRGTREWIVADVSRRLVQRERVEPQRRQQTSPASR